MTRVAEPTIKPSGLPQYCSSCMNQNPNVRHIDFEAACDRGWYGGDPALRVTMDDLVICEDCLKAAATLLEWMPTKEAIDRITNLEHRVGEEAKRADKAEAYAERMEDAFKHRPNQLKVSPPRKRGRPVAVGGPEDG